MRLKMTLLSACAALFALMLPAALAAPITYVLTLTPDMYSHLGGAGSLTVASAPSSTGVSIYSHSAGNLEDVSFNIDNQTFALNENAGDTVAHFINGQLDDIVYSALVGGGRTLFLLNTTNAYSFFNINDGVASFGTIAARPESLAASTSASVSEPASLFLFGTGLFLSIGLLYRMKSPRFASRVHQPAA